MDRKYLEKQFELYESFHDMNAFEIAYKGYEELVNNDPNDLDALWTFGVLNDYRSKDFLRQSIKKLEEALELASKQNNDFIFKKVSFQLIEVYSRNHQTHLSIEKYKELLAKNPENMDYYIFLIASYLKASQVNDAWKVCQTALKIAPIHPSVLLYAGEISQLRGQFDDAINFWDLTIKYDQEYADARYSKAFLYRRLSRTEEAIKEFNELAQWMLQRGYETEAKWATEEANKLIIDRQ